MELNYKSFGQGDPIIILHGMFGTLDNWQTIGKQLAENYTVYIVDQRNHGRSPHVDLIDYPSMAADLKEFMEAHWMFKAHIMGHSMGGKTAMQFAFDQPDMVDKLIVVDIAPRQYPGGHEQIMSALRDLDLNKVAERGEAEDFLRDRLTDYDDSVILFLMKNLSRRKGGGFEWKMNFPAIDRHYQDILGALTSDHPYEGETLFIRGENSRYIEEEDWQNTQKLFPNATLEIIAKAGHWVHAEQTDAFLKSVREFLA